MLLLRMLGAMVSAIFWLVVGGAVLFVVSLAVVVGMAPFMGYVAPFVAAGILVMLAQAIQVGRRRRAQVVLTYVDEAVRLNLPLAPMLAAAGRGERGRLGHRLNRLRDAVDGGAPVGEALYRHVPAIPLRVAGLLNAAEQCGRLPAVLAWLRREDRRRPRSPRGGADGSFALAFGLLMTAAVLLVMTGLSIFVLPELREVFEDFGAAPPGYFSLFAPFYRPPDWAPLLLAVPALLVLAMTGAGVWQIIHGGEPRTPWWRPLTDPLRWYLPPVHGITRARSTADACRLCAEVLRAGGKLEEAVRQASELPINEVLRRRLARLHERLQAGEALADAVRRVRLPRLAKGMLATVQQGSDAVAVFDFLARTYETRFSRAAEVLRAAAVPIVVMVVGVLVGAVAVGLVVPITILLNSVNIYNQGVLLW